MLFSSAQETDIGEDGRRWSFPVAEIYGTSPVAVAGVVQRHQKPEDVVFGRLAQVSIFRIVATTKKQLHHTHRGSGFLAKRTYLIKNAKKKLRSRPVLSVFAGLLN